MSGLEPFLASMFAAAGTAGTTGAAAGTAAAASGAAVAGANAAVGAGLAATAAGAVPAAGAAAAGLSATQIAALAGTGASLAGTGASLLADKPELPSAPRPATRDDAQREADMRSELYKKRGRAAALLTPGGGRGDVSSPYLGSAELMGG